MYFIEFEKLSKKTPSEWKNSPIGVNAQNIFKNLYESNKNRDFLMPKAVVQITEDCLFVSSANRNFLTFNPTPEEQKKEFMSYSFIINKNHSKFPTSKIYGLKEQLESSPNILLAKDVFKSTYRADLIPEYNYNITLDFNNKYNHNKVTEHRKVFDEQIKPIADHCIKEIIDVFAQYGEVELSPPRKQGSKLINYFIKNSINFIVEIAQKEEFKIGANGELIPNLKIEVRLQKSEVYEKKVKEKDGTIVVKKFNERYIKQSGYKHFSIEIRNFEFLKKPAYYAISMTPHGYLRLKKSYSKEFFKKIIFHYQFKKYFEKYEIEMELDELEDNPQAFFDLVAMLDF